MSVNPDIRTQTRTTITPGEPVPDNLWTITSDTGPIVGNPTNKLNIVSVIASGNDSNLPNNVIDGDLNTRWSSDGAGQWLLLDLGIIATIGDIDIAWYKGDVRTYNFDISIGNDSTSLLSVFTGKSSGTTLQPEKHAVSRAGRLVKITVNGNSQNTWASITEVAIFGSGGSPPSPPPPGPPPSPPGGDLDVEGVAKFYDDASSVKEWRLDPHDANSASDFEIEGTGSATKHAEAGVNYWNIVGKKVSYASGAPDGKTVRLNIFAPGGKGKTQTHTWKDNPTELFPDGYHNFELTDYIRVHQNTGTHTESSHKLRGGIHTGSGDARASTIELTHEIKGKAPRRAKEFDHPKYDYASCTAGSAASDGGVVENKWIGRKVVSYVNSDGSVDNHFYVDTDAFDAAGKPVNHWRLYSSWKDTKAQSSMYSPVANWSGFETTCRTDGWNNIDFALLSLREIDPTKVLAILPT